MRWLDFLNVLHHVIVSDIRKEDGNAIRGLLMDLVRTIMLVVMFYMMISFLGARSLAVRGSFILFVMTGVFLFITHVKAVKLPAKSMGPINSMLLHTPVTTVLLFSSACLSGLYTLVLSVIVVLLLTHVLLEPIEIFYLPGFALAFFIAWLAGVAVGLVFMGLTPYFPRAMPIVTQVYQRASMIFSGKMVVATSIPAFMFPWFDWHPLFHAVDQSRGYAFINYNARLTSLAYPCWVILGLFIIGMMLNHWNRKHVSASWGKR